MLIEIDDDYINPDYIISIEKEQAWKHGVLINDCNIVHVYTTHRTYQYLMSNQELQRLILATDNKEPLRMRTHDDSYYEQLAQEKLSAELRKQPPNETTDFFDRLKRSLEEKRRHT